MIPIECLMREVKEETDRFIRERASYAVSGKSKYTFVYGLRVNADGGVIMPLDYIEGVELFRDLMRSELEERGISDVKYSFKKNEKASGWQCFHLEIEQTLRGKKRIHKKSMGSGAWLFCAAVLCIVILIACYFLGAARSAKSNTKTSSAVAAPSPAYPTEYISPLEPPAVLIHSGQILKEADEECVAPFEVVTSGENGYYIYLRPNNPPFSRSMSFYVAGGKSEEVLVPLGEYDVFYATGETWRGVDNLFGKSTRYYRCDETFAFCEDNDGYTGWTVELFKQPGGNMESEEIDVSDFPG